MNVGECPRCGLTIMVSCFIAPGESRPKMHMGKPCVPENLEQNRASEATSRAAWKAKEAAK